MNARAQNGPQAAGCRMSAAPVGGWVGLALVLVASRGRLLRRVAGWLRSEEPFLAPHAAQP